MGDPRSDRGPLRSCAVDNNSLESPRCIQETTGFTDITDAELDGLVQQFMLEHGSLIGWSMISGHLKSFGLRVQRQRVRESTVQLRYIRTAHTHFIRAYFAYTRMSIRAHVRVYTRTYARIYARIWPFVMHSHKFLYLKHCLSNKGHLWE